MKHKVQFLVIGSQKSGTSALDKYLRENPIIEMAAKKEVHFFDNEENFKDGANYEKYYQYFSDNKNSIKGESTPIYMYWASSIRRIYEYNPKMKVIAILRNPIERAFSQWNMERDRGTDTVDFATAIRTEGNRCREALPFQHRCYSYIDRGFYSEQIRRIWRYFPQDQTLFIKYENFKKNPQQTLNEISNFLNVPPFNKIKEKIVNKRPYINKMAEKDRIYLESIFCHDIKQLELMLNWNCSNWR